MSIQVEINDVIPRTQSIATAGQTVFDTDWTANVESDILVYARASGVPANDATQLIASNQYNVTFIGGQRTVRVTFLSGRSDGDIVTIVRATPADRTNLYTNTNFTTSMLNQDFGILTLVDQQAQMYDTVINPRYNVSATIEEKDKVLPILGNGQVWRMNSDGTAIEAVTIDIDNIPAPSDGPYLIYKAEAVLTEAQNLGLLQTGLLKNTVNAGIATLSRAVNASDYWAPGDVIQLPGPPTNGSDATTKDYVDSIATGFSFVAPVTVATTGNFNATYDNGASGVGATLTANANGAANIDGVALALNDRVLFKDQSSSFQNGIYYVSQVGDGSNPAIFIRTTDFDTPAEIVPGMLIPVLEGTANQFTIWLNTSDPTTIGTDPIVFVQFGISTSNIVTINGNQTITGDKEFTGLVEVPTPVTGTEAANKDYVDNAALDAGGFKAFTAFTASGTWNRATGATRAIIMVLGGGGGGSGATGVTGSFIGTGDGGGAGETAWLELDISAISSVAVTIGAGGAGGPASAGSTGGSTGGTTSFGAHVSAAGGSGGNAMTTDAVTRYGLGGAGGTGGSGGDIQCPGFNGGGAFRNGASNGVSGAGASCSYGRGGLPVRSADGDQNGNSATGYGAGGGAAISASNAQRAGGNGSGGLCLVWEY